MELFYLADAPVPSRDANCVHVMKMCQALASTGALVTLLARRGRGTPNNIFKDFGVSDCFTIRLFGPTGGPLAYWLASSAVLCYVALSRRIRKSDALTYGRWTPVLSILACLGFRVAIEEHNADFKKRRAAGFLLNLASRTPNVLQIVVITDALRLDLERAFPKLAGRISVLPDGADMADVSNHVVTRRDRRPMVGYIGSFKPGKGVEEVVKIAQLMPEVDFHVVGGTEGEIAKYGQNLPAPNVFWHGYQSPARCEELRGAFDVLLAPIQEHVEGGGGLQIGRWTSPLKIFEYMASGRPMVASDVPALCEVLDHRRNALLCPPRDLERWVSCIRELLLNSALSKQLAENARHDLKTRFSWACRARNLLSLLAGKPAPESSATNAVLKRNSVD